MAQKLFCFGMPGVAAGVIVAAGAGALSTAGAGVGAGVGTTFAVD